MIVRTSGSGDPAKINFRMSSTDSFCATSPRDWICAGVRVAFSIKRPFLRALDSRAWPLVLTRCEHARGQNEIDDRRFSRRSDGTSTAEANFIASTFRLDPIHYFRPEQAKLQRFGGQFSCCRV